VELIARALSLLESSITITASSLTVKGGREPHLAPDNNNNNEGDNSRHTPISQGISAAFQMLEAFDEQGSSALQEVIRKLTKRLYDEVFLPVLNDYRHAARNNLQTTIAKTPWIFHETTSRSNANLEHLAVATNTSSASGIKHHLKWHRTNENKANEGKEEGTTTSTLNTPIAAWKETFAFLQRILAFIEEHMLLQRTNLTQLVGKRLFGKPDALPTSLSLEALGIQSTLLAEDHGVLTETILELVNETCVPSYLTVEQIQALPASADELRSFVKPFEAFLVNKSFLLPPHLSGEKASSDITRLGNFVDNLEQNYIEKRRCTILNEARNILLNKDYHNTVEVGVEVKSNKGTDLEMLDDDGMSVFQLHKSCISQSSSQLMQLCRNTMEEAVQHSSIPIDSPLALLSANLYRTARDILELFRAIIPSALSQEIAHVPRTAALLHNDCVFFSHHCLTLGLEYKDRFPAPEENKQGNLLRQTCLFVDMVPPFRDLANRSMGDMLDLQKHQLVEIVGDRITYLGETLLSNESVAEWSEAETALTAGIYHLRHLSQAWRPILSQQVFSRSMGHLADAIFALYLEQVLRVSDISQSGCHFVRALFEKASRSTMALLNDDTTGSRLWDRFTAIGSFMDMSLADIETALAQGVFRNVTGPELSRLITATFADTEKRRNLLRLLVVD
jgi:centromere/kinetochore protein ZW10